MEKNLPVEAEEHFSYGKVYFDQKDFSQAIVEFRLALDKSPESAAVIISLGRCHMARREYDDALRCFERAVEMSPGFADAHFYLGQTYLEMQKRDRAINEFKEALNINTRYKAARHSLGHLIKTQAKSGAKEQEHEKPADDEDAISRQANTHFHLGNALMQKNLMQEALVEFKEALRLRPNYPDIRNRLGELYMRRAMYGLAQEEFKLALKINPKYVAATVNLAECYRMHSEQMLDEAGNMYERALELDPRNIQASRGLEKIKEVKNLYFA